MKKCFLASYFAGVDDCFARFVQSNAAKRQVLFVPTAANVEDYTDYVGEGRQIFVQNGFEINDLDIAAADEHTVKAKLAQTPYLYISGGNTFYLLQELKKKNLLPLIRQHVRDGMIYCGESAGAIIAAPDIEYAQIMDDKTLAAELAYYQGLALTDFYIVPHYQEEPFVESAAETVKTYAHLNLLPLTNRQAVIADGQRWTVEENP